MEDMSDLHDFLDILGLVNEAKPLKVIFLSLKRQV